MPRYGVNTHRSLAWVIDKAVTYFGEGGLGLEITQQTDHTVAMEGGGGFVTVIASEGDDKTDIDITTREWDYQVKKFMEKIG